MIGVCIKYFHENYGGTLQAFATTKILEDRNINYELIRYIKKDGMWKKIKYIPRLLNGVLLNDKYEAVKKKIGMKKHPDIAKEDAKRMAAFHEFQGKYFTRLSEEYIGYDALSQGAKKYSAVITGSDQLWSPAGLPTNYYNLKFVPNSIRKISYASSFGVKNIPFYQKKRTIEFLNRLDFISMRENRGSEIVNELTGKEVPVVLDPVFMLSKERWNQAIPDKKLLDEPYIFAYFLGTDADHRKAVNELQRKTGYKIVALRHLDQYVDEDENFGDIAPYEVGPEEFLNYLRGAEYVCTDSFHGSVFSIIYEKKFMIFNRYAEGAKHSKNSRIDTLCENLGLNNRRYTHQYGIDTILNDINYSEVERNLEKLKIAANMYLDEALKNVY